MVDEVEITNVGGDGNVASEETLARLVKSMEEFASKSGIDPKSQAAKAQKAHIKTLEEDIEAIREKIKAQKEYTAVLKSTTRAISGLFTGAIGLLTSGLGIITEGLLGFAETILSGDDSLSGLVSNFPIFGSVLGRFASIIDDTYDALSLMAQSGGAFNYSLEELRVTAAESRISLEDFAAMVERNSERLAAFGGTVSRGGSMVSRLVDSMDSDLRKQLIAMGLNYEDINEQMATYLYLDRAGSRMRIQNDERTAAAAASLTKNMLTLAKLTGKDIKQKQEELAQAQMDLAFQAKMSGLNENERKKLRQQMMEAQEMYGEAGVNEVKRRFLGLPPLTEEQALFVTTQREASEQIGRVLNQALNTGIEYEDFVAGMPRRLAEGLDIFTRSLDRNMQLLTLAAGGAEGIPAMLENIMSGAGALYLKYINEQGMSVLEAQEAVIDDIKNAGETPDEGSFAQAIANFRETVSGARKIIEENLIAPFAENILTPAMNSFTGWLNGFVEDNGKGSSFERAFQFINEQITAMGTKIGTFLEQFKADPKQAISDLIEDISNFFRDAIFGKMVVTDPRLGERERQGGLLKTMIDGFETLFENDGLIQSIKENAKTVMSGFATGFSEFWNSDESNQLREDIKSFFKNITDSILLQINRTFGLFNDSVRPMLKEEAEKSASKPPEKRSQADVAAITEYLGNLFKESTDLRKGMRFSGLTDSDRDFLIQGFNENNSLIDRMKAPSAKLADEISRITDLAREGEATPEQIKILTRLFERMSGNTEFFDRYAVPEELRFSQGTKGFQDFGKGTLAMLHGKEAVIPLDSPLGKLIDELGSTAKSTSKNDNLENMISNLSNTLQNTTANQVPQEAIQELNSTMMQVLAVLRQTKTIDERIERNTSSMGGNIANGRVSSIR